MNSYRASQLHILYPNSYEECHFSNVLSQIVKEAIAYYEIPFVIGRHKNVYWPLSKDKWINIILETKFLM